MKPIVKPLVLALALIILLVCSMPSFASPSPQATSTNPPQAVALEPTQVVTLPPTLTSPPPTATAQPTKTPKPLTVDLLNTRCPSAEDIADVNSRISVTFEGEDPTAGTLLCKASSGSADLTKLQKQIYTAIIMMKYLEFDAPLPWTDKPLYEWFTSTVKGVRVRSDVGMAYCCDPEGVINLPTGLSSLESDAWLNTITRTGVQGNMVLMVHEARHVEVGGHTCGTVDTSLSEMGAFGAHYSILWWLAYHSDPNFYRPDNGDPETYRRASRDIALTMQTHPGGGSVFCADPTITPGPAPTLNP